MTTTAQTPVAEEKNARSCPDQSGLEQADSSATGSHLRYRCPDCGAPSDEDCDITCPSAAASYAEQVAVDLEAAAAEPSCCPDVAAAAAAGCYCQGTAGRAAA